jgi:hypothetical protein
MAADAVAAVWALGGALANMGVQVGVLAARFGTLLLPILGNMAAAMIPAAGTLAPLIAGFMSAAASVWAFTVALLANPITLVIAGIAALAASVYLIYKYWGPIKGFFLKLWDGIVSAFKWAWEKIKPIVDGIMKVMEFSPVGLAIKAAKGAAGELFGEGDQPTVGAAGAAPPAPGSSGEAKVTVDFANAPRGTRVTTDPQSTADVDYNLGFSMAPGT